MSSRSQNAPEAARRLPLFYREPVPLSSITHADWRLKDGDASFAAETAFVPIVVGELAAAARNYPIVFAAGDVAPVALLGLEHDNLFVADGAWTADAYVPAYVRRYPFGFIATENPDGFALAVDTGSGRVTQAGDVGAALFEDGRPSDLTVQALAFCEAFQGEVAATQAFCAALVATDMLIDRRADATLPDGRTVGLEGFQIVDAEKFAGLADDVVLDWHKRGWLALVHFHLTSLERFSALLSRQEARAAVTRS
ncbi:MAG: SapC family protein [Pseudomonadota bacterium]|uniref:SapC family protein n=1 Tax=Sphingomonas sp. ERG5 TaxID=1381597 RepID=UPI00054BEECD|nr:SapC family protein [Sphingomonas sp. ERG5]